MSLDLPSSSTFVLPLEPPHQSAPAGGGLSPRTASQPMQQPVCRRCKQPEEFDRQLFKCTLCRRSYHAACHRPVPTTNRDWICLPCERKADQRRRAERKRYNETLSLSSFLSRTNLSSRPSTSDSNMAPTTTTSSLSTADSGSASSQQQLCSYPGCKATSLSALCPDHLRMMDTKKGPTSHPRLKQSSSRLGTGPSRNHQKPGALSNGTSFQYSQGGGRSHSGDPARGQASPSQQAGLAPAKAASPGDGPARKKARLELSAYDWDDGFGVRYAVSHDILPKTESGLKQTTLSHQSLLVEPKAAVPLSRAEKSHAFVAKGEMSDHFRTSVRARYDPDSSRNGAGNSCGAVANYSPARHSSADTSPSNQSAAGSIVVKTSGGYNLQIKSWFARQAEKQAALGDASKGVGAREGLARKVSSEIEDGVNGPKASVQMPPESEESAEMAKAISGSGASTSELIAKQKAPEDLNSVTRLPATEVVRRRLVERHDDSAMDSLIYGQAGASEPPPGVKVAPLPKPNHVTNEAFYAHIDPRIHWVRPRSTKWHEEKMKEIKARGGRKANFGRVATRMREQSAQEDPAEDYEDALPDEVKADPAWVRAMKWFNECDQKQWEKMASAQQASTNGGKKPRKAVNGERKRTQSR